MRIKIKNKKRTCGSCTLCCTVLEVKALQKPQNAPCTHCVAGLGCSIYPTRPEECQGFSCGWLKSKQVPRELRPDLVHAVLDSNRDGTMMVVHQDPDFPDAYKTGILKDYLELALRHIPVIIVTGNDRKLLRNL